MKLRLNAGGKVDSSQIYGRDALVDRILLILNDQSVRLTSERRIGKTSVLTRLAAKAPKHWIVLTLDVEGVKSPSELTHVLIQQLSPHMTKRGRGWNLLQTALAEAGGTKIADLTLPSIKPHWKRLLSAAIRDVASHHPGDRLLLCLDEFPWFLDSVEKAHGWAAAAEVLDEFRAMRQQESTLRMIYTGSVGLHHITGRLEKHGYANKPLNDLALEEVPPLDEADAIALAGGLLHGESIPVTDLTACAEAIAREAGRVPFYIQHLVRQAQRRREPLQPKDAAALLDQLFLDEVADFRHFATRLKTYYGAANAKHCEAILDLLARDQAARSLREILPAVSPKITEDSLKDLLLSLTQDHYLHRHKRGNSIVYEFRYEVIRRWWAFDREL